MPKAYHFIVHHIFHSTLWAQKIASIDFRCNRACQVLLQHQSWDFKLDTTTCKLPSPNSLVHVPFHQHEGFLWEKTRLGWDSGWGFGCAMEQAFVCPQHIAMCSPCSADVRNEMQRTTQLVSQLWSIPEANPRVHSDDLLHSTAQLSFREHSLAPRYCRCTTVKWELSRLS